MEDGIDFLEQVVHLIDDLYICRHLICGLPFEFLSYFLGASLVAQLVKNLPAMQKTWVRSLGWGDPLKKGKATHSSLASITCSPVAARNGGREPVLVNLSYGSALGITGLREEQTYSLLLGQNKHNMELGQSHMLELRENRHPHRLIPSWLRR